MQLNNVKLPFGLINDRLIHIHDASKGRACGCVCPKCKRPLEARKGKIRAHYFAHYNSEECSGATETAIHLMAKQIIAESKTVKTSLFEKIPQKTDIEGNVHYGKQVKIDSREIKAEHAILEEQRQGYKPDVTLIYKNTPLLVEIKVTHQVDDDKKLKVENNHEAMLEIDLSGIDAQILLDMANFERYIIHEAPRHWIHNPRGEAQYESNLKELHARVEQINIKLYPKRQAQKKKEEHEKKKHLEFEARKSQERAKHADKLSELELYLSPTWQKQRKFIQENTIVNFPIAEKIKNAELTFGLPPLVDITVKSDWIFNVHKSVWQADILNTMVFNNETTKELNTSVVKRIIVSRYGILPIVKELNNLKQECKKIGRERDKWYQDSGCWFFSEQENRAIPSPFRPIIEYLNYLSELRLIESIGNNSFTVLISCFKQYLSFVEEEKKQQLHAIEEREKIIATKEAEKKRESELEKKRLTEIIKINNTRAKEIIASERRIFELFNGNGRLCRSCFLLSHISDGNCCPFCGADEFQEFSIAAYQIEKAYFRHSCSSRPSLSVNSNEIINNELLANWLHKLPDF